MEQTEQTKDTLAELLQTTREHPGVTIRLRNGKIYMETGGKTPKECDITVF